MCRVSDVMCLRRHVSQTSCVMCLRLGIVRQVGRILIGKYIVIFSMLTKKSNRQINWYFKYGSLCVDSGLFGWVKYQV